MDRGCSGGEIIIIISSSTCGGATQHAEQSPQEMEEVAGLGEGSEALHLRLQQQQHQALADVSLD